MVGLLVFGGFLVVVAYVVAVVSGGVSRVIAKWVFGFGVALILIGLVTLFA